MTDSTILIISSTNRKNALSRKISEVYQEILNDLGKETEILDLRDLPADFVHSALYEMSGKNEAFNPYREKMLLAKKMVFIVPEYNGSFPGVLKAFIDGLKYPNTFTNKKCALVGISSGIQGAGLALSHLTDIFNYCGMHVLAQKPKLALIEKNFDQEEGFTNTLYQKLLREQAEIFVDF
jgi:NAD(P)H-dependent FMN reductase